MRAAEFTLIARQRQELRRWADHRAGALIINPPTSFSPEASDPMQNMALRANTHIGRAVLGGFMIKAPRG